VAEIRARGGDGRRDFGNAQAPAEAQPPAAPVFGAAVELVRLDVIVLDKDGRPVKGLGNDDFLVEEDGKPQVIESFEPVVVHARRRPSDEPSRLSASHLRAPSEGRCLLVLVDDLHLTQTSALRLATALRRLLEEDVRDGDWVTLVAPEQQLWWTARTAWEHQQLAAVVGRLKGQGAGNSYADWESLRAIQSQLPGVGGRGAVMAGADAGAASPGGVGAPAGSGGTPSDEAVAGVGKADRMFLGEETEALVKRNTGITLAALRQALEALVALRGHKSLVLVSEGFLLLPEMPGYREAIDFARRANVAIHFLDPRGLEVGGGDASEPGRGARCHAGHGPRPPLSRQREPRRRDRRQRVHEHRRRAESPPPDGRVRGLLPRGLLAGEPGRRRASGEGHGEARRPDRPGAKPVLRARAGQAGPQGALAHLRRDALHTFEVPDAKAFRMSTPILTSEIEDPRGKRRPKVTLSRTFRSGSVLYCQYSVYNAPPAGKHDWAPHEFGSWTLRRGSELVREAPPTLIQPAPDGRVTRTLGLSLQGLPPGEYSLELRVRDEATGREVARQEAFTVAP
jgi:VWFA-related protein